MSELNDDPWYIMWGVEIGNLCWAREVLDNYKRTVNSSSKMFSLMLKEPCKQTTKMTGIHHGLLERKIKVTDDCSY